MNSFKIFNQLLLRIFLILIGFVTILLLLKHSLNYTSFFVFLILLILLVELFFYIKNAFLFYDKTIEAILQNDFSADFSKHKLSHNYKNLFLLFERLKNNQNQQISKDIVYQSILNNIETGILILQKINDEWIVFLMNDYFSKHFNVPKVSKWEYLKKQAPALCELIENQNFAELKTSLQIRVNKQDTQTFVMQSSRTKTYNQEYYVVLLDSIQKVVEKKEKEAWINLMKVISHELLNSITPIRSLSQNLNELIDQENLSAEDLDDIKQSVQTMLNRSNHLQQFVESYRKIAMLPSPVKEKIELNELIKNGIEIMQPLFQKNRITVFNTIDSKYWFFADKFQMEQVIINLLTNSMYAVENNSKKEITIAAETKDKRLFISISDTGKGIENEIEDKVFLPFFTTRKEGAGIGLTLSKNIIEAHGGYLTFDSSETQTKFTICLFE